MIDCLILVGDTTRGDHWVTLELGHGMYCLDAPCNVDNEDVMLGNFDRAPVIDLKGSRMYAVERGSVDTVVAMLTKEFAGKEIKVFNLTGIFSRPVGEINSKRVEEDGILP